jgi:putative ABC transport system ATP-binding protein
MEPLIRIRNLSKVYGEGAAQVTALRHVNLDANRGELLMLAGPSGSGKTTLLSIMGAILQPSGGSVCLDGREIGGLNETELPRVRLEKIGFVFQAFNLFPALTASENVQLALELKGLRARAAKAAAGNLLDQVGLSDKRNTRPAELSGGQKQRVAIARALAGDPEVILADEPTASLDSASGQVVMDMLATLAKERGRAVVVVTHDSRVLAYADRIVHLADGATCGGPAEPRSADQPEPTFVRRNAV